MGTTAKPTGHDDSLCTLQLLMSALISLLMKRDLYLADFKQDYRSNNVNNIMNKHQYWQQQGNQWKILAENTP